MASHDEIMSDSSNPNKPFRFSDSNFKRCKKKIFFYLSTKKVAHVLDDLRPWRSELELVRSVMKKNWKDSNFLCQNFILNYLFDELYNFYSNCKDSITLWKALQKKYDTEEAGSKKYAVSKYFRYHMVDETTVISQTHELQKLVHDILAERMTISEQFQVAAVIDKLPPFGKNSEFPFFIKLKNYRWRIFLFVFGSKKKTNQNTTSGKNDYSKVVCYICGLKGRIARICRRKKNAPIPQVNVTEEPLVALITEVNIVGGSEGWWVDTGASRHVCFDRKWFKMYAPADNEKKVLLGDSHTTKVLCVGDIELCFTLG
ncbi:uncharacterized protein LOC143869822 [Tasmannia lanceolata]|uniref:uncharacterized protein LOC143869822 n=1 Tax=Tasmannia lanceolata TaxID=3420 RepID=UPI004063F059